MKLDVNMPGDLYFIEGKDYHTAFGSFSDC
jgi:hypothetical protein